MPRLISITSSLLNVVAFILLLLTTLSGLYIKPMDLMILPYVPDSFPITSDIRFGVLGFCDTDIAGRSDCFGPGLGYTIPLDVVSRDSLPLSVTSIVDPGLMSILVLHPISASLSGLCAILSPFIANRALSAVALAVAVANAKLATAAFIVDVLIVVIAKRRVDTETLIVYWGAVPWMTLVAVMLLWTSVVLLATNIFIHLRSIRQQKV